MSCVIDTPQSQAFIAKVENKIKAAYPMATVNNKIIRTAWGRCLDISHTDLTEDQLVSAILEYGWAFGNTGIKIHNGSTNTVKGITVTYSFSTRAQSETPSYTPSTKKASIPNCTTLKELEVELEDFKTSPDFFGMPKETPLIFPVFTVRNANKEQVLNLMIKNLKDCGRTVVICDPQQAAPAAQPTAQQQGQQGQNSFIGKTETGTFGSTSTQTSQQTGTSGQSTIQQAQQTGWKWAVPSVIDESGNTVDIDTLLAKYAWNNSQSASETSSNFEVSTQGNALGMKFSALNAYFVEDTTINYIDSQGNVKSYIIKKGESVEDAYQKRAKGYSYKFRDKNHPEITDYGKGHAPKPGSVADEATKKLIQDGMDKEEASFQAVYLPIWQAWARQQDKTIQDNLDELFKESFLKGKSLSDHFATSQGTTSRVNQARALMVILFERATKGKEGHLEVNKKEHQIVWVETNGQQHPLFAVTTKVEEKLAPKLNKKGGTQPKQQPAAKTPEKPKEKLPLTDNQKQECEEQVNKMNAILDKFDDDGDFAILRNTSAEENTNWATIKKNIQETVKKAIDKHDASLLDPLIKNEKNLSSLNSAMTYINAIKNILNFEGFDEKLMKPQLTHHQQQSATASEETAYDKLNKVLDGEKQQYRAKNIALKFHNRVANYRNKVFKELKQQLTEMERNGETDTAEYLRKKIAFEQISGSKGFQYALSLMGGSYVVLNDIYQEFKRNSEYDENKLADELYKIYKENPANDKFSDDKLRKTAQEQVKYKIEQWKILADKDLFRCLCERAAAIIKENDRISVNIDNIAIDDDFDENIEDVDLLEKEEIPLDQVVDDFREIDEYARMSTSIRSILGNVRMTDEYGNDMLDDMGEYVHLDAHTVHNILMVTLSKMSSPADMDELLLQILDEHPELTRLVEQILGIQSVANNASYLTKKDSSLSSAITQLQQAKSVREKYQIMKNNSSLMTAAYQRDVRLASLRNGFYQVYRKNRNAYSIQITYKKEDGTQGSKMIYMADLDSNSTTVETWAATVQSGIILNHDAVYGKNGNVNIKKVNALRQKVEELSKLLYKQNKDGDYVYSDQSLRADYTKPDDNGNPNDGLLNSKALELKHWLQAIGIDVDDRRLAIVLNMSFPDGKRYYSGVVRIVNNILNILKYPKTNLDLVTQKQNFYAKLASMLKEADDIGKNLMVHTNEKDYQVMTNPNYITDLVKQLKNVMNDEEKFNKFINEKFKKYDFFWDSGNDSRYNGKDDPARWRCDWLRQLTEKGQSGIEAREALKHTVNLHRDGTVYEDMNKGQYFLTCLGYYFSDPSRNTAYFPVPVMSNAPTCEFIRFRRIQKTGSEDTVVKQVNEKMVGVALQEITRMRLVYARTLDQNGIKIKNWDAKTEDGKVTKNGGLEFRFLPELNTLTIKELVDAGKLNEKFNSGKEHGLTVLRFIQKYGIQNKVTNASTKKIKSLLEASVAHVNEVNFEDEMVEYEKMHIFDRTYAGKGDGYQFIGTYGKDTDQQELIRPLHVDNKHIIDACEKVLGGVNRKSADPNLQKSIASVQKLKSDLENGKHNTPKEWAKLMEDLNYAAKSLNETDKKYFLNYGGHSYSTVEEGLNALKIDKIKDTARDMLQDYYYNNVFATSQILELTIGDVAFTKSVIDFYKRNKQIYGAGLRLNTEAMYTSPIDRHVEKIGREKEYSITLADEEIITGIADSIKPSLDQAYRKGELSAEQYAFIMASYGAYNETIDGVNYYTFDDKKTKKKISVKSQKTNVTDGQAFRSLDSYRATMIMSGVENWTYEMEQAYQAIKKGEKLQPWQLFNLLHTTWQTKKPFVYTSVDMTVKDSDGNVKHIKVPVQRKNSEFLLLAGLQMVGSNTPLTKSAQKLIGLQRFMEKHGIDTVQFESCIKVGAHGVIDINDCQTAEDVVSRLEEATGAVKATDGKGHVTDASQFTSRVQVTDFADYQLQTSTPEHFLDTMSILGTQIRKLIYSDMPDDAEMTMCDSYTRDKSGNLVPVNPHTMTKAEWMKYYQGMLTANIVTSMMQVAQDLNTPQKISDFLRRKIMQSSDYDPELLKAIQIAPDGNFSLPLTDPVMMNKIQQYLLSIMRNKVINQKIKGGQLIQVTSYGLDSSLKIVHAKRKNAKGEKEDYIAYAECLMPAWSRDFFEAFMDENGVLDFNKVPEELKQMVGFRIPTEGLCSSLPLKVVGFLPQQNGSAIMLPREITTISGSDFDVDKLFMLFYEFKVNYRMDDARRDYREEARTQSQINRILQGSNLGLQDTDLGDIYKTFSPDDLDQPMLTEEEFMTGKSAQDPTLYNTQRYRHARIYTYYNEYTEAFKKAQDAHKKVFRQWFAANKHKYLDKKKPITKITVDWKKNPDPLKMTRQERNNAIIDLMRGALSSSWAAPLIMAPQGYQTHKDTSRMCAVLTQCTREQLTDLMTKAGIKITNNKHPERQLEKLSFEQLDTMFNMLGNSRSLLRPSTQVYFQHQNMSGNNLVGSYALNNVAHSICQQTQIRLQTPITFLGHKIEYLDRRLAFDGSIISKAVGGFSGASVDNAKDPILAFLQQNDTTTPITMFLVRAGLSVREVGLFLNQPAVREVIERCTEGIDFHEWLTVAVRNVKDDYAKRAGAITDEIDEIKDISADDMTSDIITGNDLAADPNALKGKQLKAYLMRQLYCLEKFLEFSGHGQNLNTVTLGLRGGTRRGGPRGSIYLSQQNSQSAKDLLELCEQSKRAEEAMQKKARGEDVQVPNAPFLGISNLLVRSYGDPINNKDRQKIYDDCQSSAVGSESAFATSNMTLPYNIMSPYFPHFSAIIEGSGDFHGIMDTLQHMAVVHLSSDMKNKIIMEFMDYMATRLEFFGKETQTNAQKKREQYIHKFPEYFEKLMKLPKYKELRKSNAFLHNLTIETFKGGKTKGEKYIAFRYVGTLKGTKLIDVQHGWEELSQSEEEVLQALAEQLMLYTFYRMGLGFGSTTFAHLIPVSLRKLIPGYRELFKNLPQELEDAYYRKGKYEGLSLNGATKPFLLFIDQYIYNHLGEGIFEQDIPAYQKISVVSKTPDYSGTYPTFTPNNEEDNQSFEISINEKGYTDKKGPLDVLTQKQNKLFVKGIHQDSKGVHIIYKPFVMMHDSKGNKYFYKYKSSRSAGKSAYYTNGVATYERIDPLGERNKFLEYEFDTSIEDMTSAIDQRKQEEQDENDDDVKIYDLLNDASSVSSQGQTQNDTAEFERLLSEAPTVNDVIFTPEGKGTNAQQNSNDSNIYSINASPMLISKKNGKPVTINYETRTKDDKNNNIC